MEDPAGAEVVCQRDAERLAHRDVRLHRAPIHEVGGDLEDARTIHRRLPCERQVVAFRSRHRQHWRRRQQPRGMSCGDKLFGTNPFTARRWWT